MTIDEAIQDIEKNILPVAGGKSVRMALSALREKAERDNPKPLTLDELRKMDGQPVWTVTIGLDNIFGCEILGFFEPGPDDREIISMCNLTDGSYDVFADLYGKTWLAYRYPPKEENK